MVQQPFERRGAAGGTYGGTAAALEWRAMMVMAFIVSRWLDQHVNGTVYPLVLSLSFWCVVTALASWTLVRKYGAPTLP